MAFRRGFDRPDQRVQSYRPSDRWEGDLAGDDQSQRYRPRPQRGFGWARRRDIEDQSSQGAAPRRGGRYDRTGEDHYAQGFDEFEHGGEPEHGRYALGRDAGGYGGSSPARWELDEGGVQFGARPRHEPSGPYRGRGPRGYQRSDERIREDVCERLTMAHDVDASGIEVQVAEGMVTLTGTVEDRYAKRRSEDIAEAVSGVRDVQNQLRVQPPGQSGQGGA